MNENNKSLIAELLTVIDQIYENISAVAAKKPALATLSSQHTPRLRPRTICRTSRRSEACYGAW
jgi:hypothetical protein